MKITIFLRNSFQQCLPSTSSCFRVWPVCLHLTNVLSVLTRLSTKINKTWPLVTGALRKTGPFPCSNGAVPAEPASVRLRQLGDDSLSEDPEVVNGGQVHRSSASSSSCVQRLRINSRVCLSLSQPTHEVDR